MIAQLLETIMRCEPSHPDWTCFTNYTALRREVLKFKASPENLAHLRDEGSKNKGIRNDEVFAHLLMADDKWKSYPLIKAEVEAHMRRIQQQGK